MRVMIADSLRCFHNSTHLEQRCSPKKREVLREVVPFRSRSRRKGARACCVLHGARCVHGFPLRAGDLRRPKRHFGFLLTETIPLANLSKLSFFTSEGGYCQRSKRCSSGNFSQPPD